MLCLRVILIAPWHCTHMFSGATGTLLASPKVESKTDRVALRRTRMHTLQSLRHRFSLLVFATFLSPFCIALVKLVGTKLAFACWWLLALLVLVRLVCTARRCRM